MMLSAVDFMKHEKNTWKNIRIIAKTRKTTPKISPPYLRSVKASMSELSESIQKSPTGQEFSVLVTEYKKALLFSVWFSRLTPPIT